MKNSNYIINGILIAAVIVLFILQFTGKKTGTKYPDTTMVSVADSTDFRLPIAYVRTDSLFPNYKFYNDLSNEMMKIRDDKTLLVKRRQEKFTKDVLDYQEKVNSNVFYSPERQMQAENVLRGQQQDLEKYMASIEQELEFEFGKMSQQLNDTIVTALRLFNTPKKYEVIFSNAGTDNILYADDIYDITVEFTEFLNARYVPAKK